MNFGDHVAIDKLLWKEIDALPPEEQRAKLRVELEALICEKHELLEHITLLQSQVSKLQMVD